MSTRFGDPRADADRSGEPGQGGSTSTRRRRTRRGSKLPNGKPLYQHWWAWVLLGAGASLGGGAITAYQTVQSIERGLPNTGDVFTYVRNGTLTLRSSDGSILQQLGPATRQKLTLDQIPPQMAEAFIASEDADFYQHSGVDYAAIGRATLRNVKAGALVEGASTITQQLARLVFLDQERSFGRKLREALLAQKIERELSKQQILERYLNLVYLGSGAYGVADAAWIYFSKPVSKLTLSEIATIAGLPPAPSVYSPLVDLDAARQRRDLVLGRMVKSGYLTAAQRDAAIAAPVTLKPSQPRNFYSNVPYFTSYIQQQLPKYVTPEQLEMGGLTVETTLNLKWQITAQQAIKRAIERYGPGEAFEQASLVSLDPRSGEIKALVGGNDFNKSQFNRATQAQRQPGSTFKGLVYTTAIAAGFSPYRSYEDQKFIVDGYEPQNYGRTFRGSVTMRDALISSVNVVAVKVLIDVGFDPVVQMAKRMGIRSKLVPAYSMALGASEVNLLELTSAYGTLAAQGNHAEPHGIRRILDRTGKVVYEANAKPKRAVDANTAAIMTWMLRGVVTNGTGGNAQLGDRSVAGKTGTSEQRRDLWFIGYIPQLVTGVWLGNDNSRPTWGASSTAALTWHDFMVEAVKGMAVQRFPELPQLGGRKGSIAAKPVKPRRVSNQGSGRTTDEENARHDSSDQSSYDAPRRRREPDPQPAEARSPSYNAPPRAAEQDKQPPLPAPEPVAPPPPAPEPAAPAPEPPTIEAPPPEAAPIETAPPPASAAPDPASP